MFPKEKQAELHRHVSEILLMHPAFDRALSKMERIFTSMQWCREATGLSIIGESRSGKSRLLEHFAQLHPIVRTEEARVVPFLWVRIPSKPLISTLAETLLRALGDQRFASGRETDKTNRVEKLLEKCGTRVIALDEFQHFRDKATLAVQHHAADWLKLRVENCGLGLFVAGLESSIDVLRANEQLDGRLQAPVRLGRFRWMVENDRREFLEILGSLQEAMLPFEIPDLANDEMAIRCYCATGGLIGYLMKILKTASENVIDRESLKIGLPELAEAFNEAVRRDNPSQEENPFGDNFFKVSHEIRLARAASIGVRTDGPQRRANRAKTKAPSEPPVASILCAHSSAA